MTGPVTPPGRVIIIWEVEFDRYDHQI